jgi:hypothetical protein
MMRGVRRRAVVKLLATFMVAAAAACGESGESPTQSGGDTVVVAASAGTTPTYSWNGPFAVSINVARAGAPSVAVWGISSPINRNIASGAQQGVVPPGASETATTERTLSAGVRYRVTVALADGTSGSVDFTP